MKDTLEYQIIKIVKLNIGNVVKVDNQVVAVFCRMLRKSQFSHSVTLLSGSVFVIEYKSINCIYF